MLQLAEYNEKGETQRLADLREPSKMWQHPWQLVHRVRLHNNLKKTAQEAGAILNLSSRVAEVDPEKGTLTFESGKIINADVIVGADGIYVSKLCADSVAKKLTFCAVQNKSIDRR